MDVICRSENCTLCMACANACPKNAICVSQDEYGYERLAIDRVRCIDCGLCKQVCDSRGKVVRNEPQVAFAAQMKDKSNLRKSASGGAFQVLAQIVLEEGGVCYGCAFDREGGAFRAEHKRVDSREALSVLLNSKYIPSMIGNAYREAQKDLKMGRKVLFSGTPCQIQGLHAFLKQDYDNLFTADIICHGVTSTKIFNDYIGYIEARNGIKIVSYFFRDKKISWGTNFCYSYYKLNDPSKRIHEAHWPREESSYMMQYLRGNIFRENCYFCGLSNTARVSDFTLGDYWGIEREHPELATRKEARIVLRQGVSCVLVNTDKALKLADLLQEKMVLHEVPLVSVVAHNGNLREASPRGANRDLILNIYREQGYAQIEKDYQKETGRKIAIYRAKNALKACLPDRVRIMMYNSPTLRRIIFHD